MSVKIYSNLDPGAPPHPGSGRGSMAALLRACLIDGYFLGEDITYGAGWEEVFPEANNYAAFRSLVGARQIFQIDDNMSSADVAYISACESLSAVDAAPIGRWGEDYFGKQYDLAHSTSWSVIADERTCYVFLHGYYGMIVHGFGEFDSLVPNDPYNSFMCGHSSSINLASDVTLGLHYGYDLGASGCGVEMHRSANGTFAANGGIVKLGTSYVPGGKYNQSSPDSANTGLGFFTSPVLLTCDDAQEGDNKIIRGRLRGLYRPEAYRPYSDKEEYLDALTGKTMKQFNFDSSSSGTYGGCYMIDVNGPW